MKSLQLVQFDVNNLNVLPSFQMIFWMKKLDLHLFYSSFMIYQSLN
jgi:hypothetical protein